MAPSVTPSASSGALAEGESLAPPGESLSSAPPTRWARRGAASGPEGQKVDGLLPDSNNNNSNNSNNDSNNNKSNNNNDNNNSNNNNNKSNKSNNNNNDNSRGSVEEWWDAQSSSRPGPCPEREDPMRASQQQQQQQQQQRQQLQQEQEKQQQQQQQEQASRRPEPDGVEVDWSHKVQVDRSPRRPEQKKLEAEVKEEKPWQPSLFRKETLRTGLVASLPPAPVSSKTGPLGAFTRALGQTRSAAQAGADARPVVRRGPIGAAVVPPAVATTTARSQLESTEQRAGNKVLEQATSDGDGKQPQNTQAKTEIHEETLTKPSTRDKKLGLRSTSEQGELLAPQTATEAKPKKASGKKVASEPKHVVQVTREMPAQTLLTDSKEGNQKEKPKRLQPAKTSPVGEGPARTGRVWQGSKLVTPDQTVVAQVAEEVALSPKKLPPEKLPPKKVSAAAASKAAAVVELCDMGFARPDVERCLKAALYNTERAVAYLMSGVPAEETWTEVPKASAAKKPAASAQDEVLAVEETECHEARPKVKAAKKPTKPAKEAPDAIATGDIAATEDSVGKGIATEDLVARDLVALLGIDLQAKGISAQCEAPLPASEVKPPDREGPPREPVQIEESEEPVDVLETYFAAVQAGQGYRDALCTVAAIHELPQAEADRSVRELVQRKLKTGVDSEEAKLLSQAGTCGKVAAASKAAAIVELCDMGFARPDVERKPCTIQSGRSSKLVQLELDNFLLRAKELENPQDALANQSSRAVRDGKGSEAIGTTAGGSLRRDQQGGSQESREEAEEDEEEDAFLAVCAGCGAVHLVSVDVMGMDLDFRCSEVGLECEVESQGGGLKAAKADIGSETEPAAPLTAAERQELAKKYSVNWQSAWKSKKEAARIIHDLIRTKGDGPKIRYLDAATSGPELVTYLNPSLAQKKKQDAKDEVMK
ncbi:unnamed protein product, partial [Polarella glacialis]